MSSATKHIQPATTARNPSESAWATIRSSDNHQAKHRHPHPHQCAFNLHPRLLIIPRRLLPHRSFPHRRPQLPPRSLSTPRWWCQAATPRVPTQRLHLLSLPERATTILLQLTRYCEGSTLPQEATHPLRELPVPHPDLPRPRCPASILRPGIRSRRSAQVNRPSTRQLLNHLRQLFPSPIQRPRGQTPETRSASSILPYPEVGITILSPDPRRNSFASRFPLWTARDHFRSHGINQQRR